MLIRPLNHGALLERHQGLDGFLQIGQILGPLHLQIEPIFRIVELTFW